jgi:hypothetical protein
LLIEVKGMRLLRDQRVREDPAGACDEEASRTPRGKRMPAAEINQQDNFTNTKKAVSKSIHTKYFRDRLSFLL